MKRLLLLLLVLLAAPAYGQEATAALDRTQVELGRSLQLTIEVRVPNGSGYAPPEAEALQVPPFEVRDAVRVALPPEEGARRWRYTLRIAAYEPGKLTLPALDFGGAKTRPLQVEVEQAPPDPPGQIRGLKGPLPPSSGGWTVAGAVVLALIVASLLVWLVRKLLPKPRWTPERELLAALDAAGAPGERLAAAGDAVRAYLAHTRQLPLQKRTTSEIVRELDLPKPLRDLLEEADLAKFARHEPSSEDLARHLQAARDLVPR